MCTSSKAVLKVLICVFVRFDETVWRTLLPSAIQQKGRFTPHQECPSLPYSLDLALRNFWLLPQAKMKGRAFELIQDIEATTGAQLSTFCILEFLLSFPKPCFLMKVS